MPFVKINPEPGLVKAGTDYQTGGRWIDSNGFRWHRGDMLPIGGWQKVEVSAGTDVDFSGPGLGSHAWRDNDGDAHLVVGTDTACFSFSEGTQTDITIAGMTTGNPDATIGTLYDAGLYDAGLYGVGDPAAATIIEANSWQFDNFGQFPVAWAWADGDIWDWDLNTANNLVIVANAPTGNLGGIVVTPQRHLVALGAGGDVRSVQWSDKEARTVWTDLATNEAGSFPLQGSGEIQCGGRYKRATLIWTTTDLWSMNFVGGNSVFGFTQEADDCGIIGRRAKASAKGLHFWMGHGGFFAYNGFVQSVPCSIQDFVYSDINRDQASKFWAVTRAEFDEVWFYYCSSAATDIDRAAIFNYEEGYWYLAYGPNRTTGVDRGVFNYPMLTDSTGALYDHERGTSRLDTDDATEVSQYAETGPFELGNGDQTAMITGILPDQGTFGDISMTLYARDYPTGTERNTGTITLSSDTMTSTRISGRQARVRIDSIAANSRPGAVRLEVKPTGKRT